MEASSSTTRTRTRPGGVRWAVEAAIPILLRRTAVPEEVGDAARAVGAEEEPDERARHRVRGVRLQPREVLDHAAGLGVAPHGRRQGTAPHPSTTAHGA